MFSLIFLFIGIRHNTIFSQDKNRVYCVLASKKCYLRDKCPSPVLQNLCLCQRLGRPLQFKFTLTHTKGILETFRKKTIKQNIEQTKNSILNPVASSVNSNTQKGQHAARFIFKH